MGFHLFTARTKHGANVRLPFTVTQQTEIASTGNITLNTQQLDLLRLIYPSIPLKLRVITTTFNDGVDD